MKASDLKKAETYFDELKEVKSCLKKVVSLPETGNYSVCWVFTDRGQTHSANIPISKWDLHALIDKRCTDLKQNLKQLGVEPE